jgi:hypothetical protein
MLAAPVAVLGGDLEPPGPPAPTMRTLESLGFDCPNDPAGTTNLLFPFVTNQTGFDTGFSIANTGADPFGTTGQTGTCTLSFFGTNPPAAVVTPSIAPGAMHVSLASVAAPNFQGYMIAVCNFAYGHGFAFITDGPIGQASVASSYLARTICRDRNWNLGNGQ